jgi:nitrate reductase gamma subunit
MTGLSVFYAALLYVAAAVLVVGLALKIRQYWTTPAPLKIVVTPAPVSQAGAYVRVLREVALFESLFFSNRWLWIFAMVFHAGLALVLVRHLRYFINPVCDILALIQPLGVYGGMAMLAGLFILLARRFMIDRVRYVTRPSDVLMLLLLIGIGVSGFGMKFVNHTDIVAVKAFIMGLYVFDIRDLPSEPPLLAHLFMVALLMIVFPFSKLLHVPGVFFSPTRNMADDPREKRHLAPWAAKLEG